MDAFVNAFIFIRYCTGTAKELQAAVRNFRVFARVMVPIFFLHVMEKF